jgi:CDP-glucose 4,6-dehydratase
VLESVAGYLSLGQRLLQRGEKDRVLNFNFGPDFEAERSVQDLMDAWLAAWPGACTVQRSAEPTYGEAARLSLDHNRAVRELGWKPVWDFNTTVTQTAAWYRARHEAGADNAAMLQFSQEQINTYAADASQVGTAWTR